MGMKPSVQNHDPTPGAVKPVQGDISQFLQGIFGGGQNPFAGQSSPLQQQAVGNMQSFLNMPAPEQRVFDQMNPILSQMAQGQGLQNPFGDMGAVDRGQQTIAAAQPVFQQNLAAAQGNLNSAAPGRFGSAFVQQGIDQNSRALNDFNLFSAQQMQQGQAQQQRERESALQFQLGAAGAQQGAAGLLGQLGGMAGQNPFQRALGAGQFGQQQQMNEMGPLLQLMLGGMGWAQPMGQEAIVGPSPFQQWAGLAGNIANGYMASQGRG